jgi:crotonobetainyl-CoA:carnitine CoA-transferase CaiB-like acyl-CoA transferase
MMVTIEYAKLGPVEALGLPVKFSDTAGAVRIGAPVQHTRAVLLEHRFSESDIEARDAEGAIVLPTTESRNGG